MRRSKVHCTAVVLAGGCGRRMGTKLAKQYLKLRGRPVLSYCLETFEKSALIDEVILVVGKGQVSYCHQHIVDKYGFHKVKTIVEGGAERYHSVWEGLRVLDREEMTNSYVFIHDGTRPFINERILERAYEEVCKGGACVVGMPVKDTIKIADDEGYIRMTPRRDLVWQIQTPQVFSVGLILPAYREVIEREKELLEQGVLITDDAMVIEKVCQYPVRIVEGSYENIKITTPEDLKIADIFAARFCNDQRREQAEKPSHIYHMLVAGGYGGND